MDDRSHASREKSEWPHTVQQGGLWISTDYAPHLKRAGLNTLDALFQLRDAESLTKPGLDAWRERLRLTIDIHGTPATVYLKRFTNPPRSAMREVRRSRSGARSVAGVEWCWMHRLANEGVRCAKPIAFGEQFDGRRERRSAVLMAAAEGQSLERMAARPSHEATEARSHEVKIPHAERRGEAIFDRDTLGSVLSESAALVSKLHAAGYVHRDLYLSHLFCHRTPDGVRLTLIDLQRVFAPTWRLRRWVVKDLAALDFSTPRGLISRTDRLRWLCRYLGMTRLDCGAKRMVYAVMGKSLRLARRTARRSRPTVGGGVV